MCISNEIFVLFTYASTHVHIDIYYLYIACIVLPGTLVSQTLQTEEEGESNRISHVNLVDLAGSERSDAAGTSGIRLRVRASQILSIALLFEWALSPF